MSAAVENSPQDELARADAAGLVARWPELPALLATADPATVRRIGARLATVAPDDVLAAHPRARELPVTVTGSSTLAPLVPALTGELARHGFLARIALGDPGGYALALAADPAPHSTTLCLLDAGAVFDRFGDEPWLVADVEQAADAVRAELTAAAARHAAAGATLVLSTPPLWSSWPDRVLDLRERARLGAVWRRFTADLLDLGGPDGPDGTYVIDTDPIAGDTGPARDARLERYTHVAFTDPWLSALARRFGHLLRGLHGTPRKCLVLDLDGTLWGGTLAETGPDGLDMAEGFRGEAHRAFQRTVAHLGRQGVLLAVCSKNDPDEVAAVLAEHPDLLVRADALTAVAASWDPKPDAIGRIAQSIGIGTDSLVLVDDNRSETGSVRERFPEIVTVDVDADDPAGHVGALLADGWFDSPAITDEDRERAGRYRTEARRAEFRAGVDGVEEYLAGLGTRLEVFVPGPADVARVAQLTRRTNQFNLTTVRLDDRSVHDRLADPQELTVAVQVGDRFGDHGLIGAAFARWSGTGPERTLRIENLVMSCRVLGRGVESAWIAELLRHAADGGATAVLAGYRPSPRNARVRELWPDHGFVADGTGPDDELRFRHPLDPLPGTPPHVHVRATLPAPTGGSR
ncbi:MULTISPECIES: HAD-IIIC family phosphatase [Pseudonocardia]|uniref:Uncharacterized protein n=2 Tax=Pseudonocardia TaxID=1847 RepID=A0A1Y2N5S2_PSEAH|nr:MULTISPECIES: HAD-IIIC family phosphatase [Pseudonocardia]OSY42812.1 hypothetical protein BG845_01053 [Pseudonocardia autotrophica]TDN77389.1 D-glyceryl-ACP synthase [Pseudonocardia autotrophica]BBG01412.1 HAD-superfamily phosphatase, subfamily IIIC:FkbH [Pseudonocardia autotrophica]GEC24468.1 HAD-superfamily phosphatase, subfamily IIIC:FkbH [Pseudonocardia saturnea]